MAEALDNAPTAVASVTEPRADQIQYLTPVPPGFNAEYDYLALVQSLGGTAGGATLNHLVGVLSHIPKDPGPGRSQPPSRALLIGSSGVLPWDWRIEWTMKDSEVGWIYDQIQFVRQEFARNSHEGTRVLLIDSIFRPMAQVLGAALNLDPTFLWRRYGEGLDLNYHGLELARLRSDFFARAAASSEDRVGEDINQKPTFSSTREDRSVHLT